MGWLHLISAMATVALLVSESRAEPVPPAQWPAAVRAAYRTAVADCREAGGRMRGDGTGYAERAELNGDGRPDYIISDHMLECEGAASYFCGSGGCNVFVYLSNGSGFREPDGGLVQGYALIPGSPPSLRIAAHGSACGRVGADTCYGEWVFGSGRMAYRPMPARGMTGALWMTGSTGWRADPARGAARIDLPVGRYRSVSITCPSGRPQLAIDMRETANLPRELAVEMVEQPAVSAANPPPVPVTLRRADDGRTWTAAADRTLIALLTGPADAAQPVLPQSAGDGELYLEQIPLGGSTRAIRAALANCGTGGAPVASPAASAVPPNPVPPSRRARLGRFGNWTVSRTADGGIFTLALIPSGPAEGIGIMCRGGSAEVSLATRGRPPAAATLELVADGRRVVVPMRATGQGLRSVGTDNAIVLLLSGSAAAADLRLDGRSAGRVSLAGAREALAETFVECRAARE